MPGLLEKIKILSQQLKLEEAQMRGQHQHDKDMTVGHVANQTAPAAPPVIDLDEEEVPEKVGLGGYPGSGIQERLQRFIGPAMQRLRDYNQTLPERKPVLTNGDPTGDGRLEKFFGRTQEGNAQRDAERIRPYNEKVREFAIPIARRIGMDSGETTPSEDKADNLNEAIRNLEHQRDMADTSGLRKRLKDQGVE